MKMRGSFPSRHLLLKATSIYLSTNLHLLLSMYPFVILLCAHFFLLVSGGGGGIHV